VGTSTQPTDFSDLKVALLDAMRETNTDTTALAYAGRYINTALHDMHIDWDLPWAIRRATLITHPTYTTGTIAVSAGGTAVTGTDTLWATANSWGVANVRAGGKIILGAVSEGVYEVASTPAVADTTLSVTSKYTGTDALTASGYTYFEDEYALAADFLRSIHPRQFSDNLKLSLLGREEFTRRYPRNTHTGAPKLATIIELPPSGNTTRVQKVVFHPAPDLAYKVDYTYVTSYLATTSAGAAQTQLVGTTDEPIVPLMYRHTIVAHAKWLWLFDRKDDRRYVDAKADYEQLMRRIAASTTNTADHPRFQPQVARYFAFTARRRRQRYSTDSRFDELAD
jgi:hypothetical protein